MQRNILFLILISRSKIASLLISVARSKIPLAAEHSGVELRGFIAGSNVGPGVAGDRGVASNIARKQDEKFITLCFSNQIHIPNTHAPTLPPLANCTSL